MAKRDLDKEFKDNLQGQGPFQFSEENWKAASAMLDSQLPVAAGSKFFNRTTVILSIAVVFLFSLTLLLPLNEDAQIDQSETEYPLSESGKPTLNPSINEVRNTPVKETEQNENFKSSSYEDISTAETKTAADAVSSDPNENSTVYTETNNTIKENTPKESQTSVNVSKGEFNSDEAIKSESTIETEVTVAASLNALDETNEATKPERSTEAEIASTSLNTASGNESDKAGEASKSENSIEPEIASVILNSTSSSEPGEIAANKILQNGDANANFNAIDEEINKEPEALASSKNETAETENSQDNSNVPIVAAAKKSAKTNNRLGQNYFKVGFETGIFATHRTLKALDLDCEDYTMKRNNQESMKPSYSFGLNFGQQINKLNWQIGVNYSTYQENISYNNEVLGLDVLDNGYWNAFNSIDTTVRSNWVIDSIYSGYWDFDTTFVNVVDSNYVEQWDTSSVVKLDSTMQQNNGVHNLSYFEVPLFVGYTFGKNKWLFDVQPGVSIGFLSGSRQSRYIDKSLSGLVEPSNNLEQFNTIIWKAHFRIGVRYAFDKWDFGVYPHYSYTLNNVLNSTKVDQRFGNFGVSIGAYYKF